MKKISIYLILLFNSLLFSQWSEIKQNQLVTFGSSTLYFPADIAELSFNVSGLESSVDIAVKPSADKMKQIFKKLKEIGISEDQLQTSYFNSADNPEGKSWWSSSKDFKTFFEIIIRFNDFSLIEPVIDILSEEQVENISKLHFKISSYNDKLLLAHKAAAEEGRKKAELIAQTLGAKIDRVLFIEDLTGYNNIEITAQAPPNYIFTGKDLPVTSRLKIVFELAYEKQ